MEALGQVWDMYNNGLYLKPGKQDTYHRAFDMI